ncbi:MAG: two-component regulator propeller domain-containing protein [Bacteroidota bacterium]
MLLALCISSLHGQESFTFGHIDSKQGLSQNSVFAVIQDDDGFMWFGTRNGLNRFDGHRFRVFGQEESAEITQNLSGADIRTLYYDSHIQKLWVCSLNGMLQYRPSTDDFRSFPFLHASKTSPQNVSVNCLHRDPSGTLWAGTRNGLYRWDEREAAFLLCLPPRNIDKFEIKAIYPAKEGWIWIGTNKGLFKFKSDPKGYIQFAAPPQDPALQQMFASDIRLICQDDQGYMWLGVQEKGMYAWKAGEKPTFFQHDPSDPFSLDNDDVRAIAKDPSGRIWIGTFSGLNIYDPLKGGFKRVRHQESNPKSLGSGSVRSIFFDKRGSAWIGTYYGGVSYWNPEAYRFSYNRPNGSPKGISHGVVSSFMEDKKGNLWVGTEGGGLNYWDRREGTFTHYKHKTGQATGLSGNNVKIIYGGEDSLWIGTFASGLNLFHIKSGKWEYFRNQRGSIPSLSHNNVYDLLEKDGHLWIATYGGGINRLNLRTKQFSVSQHQFDDTTSLSSNLTRVLIQDKNQNIWVGSNRGLDRVDIQPDGSLHFTHFLKDRMICSMIEARDGTLWVGTYQEGVWVLDKNRQTVHHFTKEEGLPGQAVFGLLEDKKGRIWVSTEKGLAKIDRRDLSIVDYNYSDGIENLEYNFHAYYKTQSGEMFFGGTQGFTSFFPDQIRTNTFVPPVVFSEFSYLNTLVKPGDETGLLQQSINETQQLTFLYGQADFAINFAALDFLNPQNNQYAVKLEGLDKDWRYSKGETEASYNLQNWGNYTLRLKGGNNDGIWNQNERTIRIKVLPPPWRTTTAYIIYGSVLILLVSFGFWLIQMRQNLQFEKVMKTQQEALHQAKLRFYTNVTHELRTPLTLILGPIEELLEGNTSIQDAQKLGSIRQNAQRLLRLVNQLLNFRSLEHDHKQLEVAEGNIVKFLREISLSFYDQARLHDIQFTFHSQLDEIALWYDRDKLEKVFYNFLSNAFKFTPRGGSISMAILDMPQEVQVKVCDSGPGIPVGTQQSIFERFYHQNPVKEAQQESSGIGLALSKQLVEMHGGTIDIANLPDSGACFTIHFSKGHNHFNPEELLSSFRDSEDIDGYFLKTVQDKASEKVDPLTDLKQEGEQISLLIVEDNEDVRSYIKEVFEPHFQIEEASNGREGLKKVKTSTPDLIISDVMMPEMDGIQMCHQLKSQLETSHIPIILLTARTGQIFRVQGIETGADAYITKPFSPYELKLQVKNLLELRNRIRQRFQSVLKLEPGEITVTSSDQAFITQAIEVVEKYMEDPDFLVETFARELAVSRPLLFTKMKAITNQTPNNFVKALRMKRSAQLLIQADWGVAEIAYQVGFRDARYFSKCFYKEFGMTPSEYRAKNQSPST